MEDEYKTGTLGKEEEEVRKKFTHKHVWNSVEKCYICGREKNPLWGKEPKWKSGKGSHPTT